MGLLDGLFGRTFGNLEKILTDRKLTNWTVSLGGHSVGPVNSAKVGVKIPGTFWVNIDFEVGGIKHTLLGERPLTSSKSSVIFDGKEVPSAYITLKKHVKGFSVKVEID